MKLYHKVERIYNELRELGIGEDESFSADAIFAYDQYHYLGTDAVDEAVRRLGIGPGTRVLDVGSGLGGPARYLASRTGCRVTAVEIQPDVHRVAVDLTRRCGLAERIEHVDGDFLSGCVPSGGFDVAVSWLAFLHIPDRGTLLSRFHEALAPGGTMYAEDFHVIDGFTPEEQRAMEVDLYCEYLPGITELSSQLERAGFVDVQVEDLTGAWTEFTAGRSRGWNGARERHLRVHGEDVFEALAHFYDVVIELFHGGHLGGARMSARKG